MSRWIRRVAGAQMKAADRTRTSRVVLIKAISIHLAKTTLAFARRS